jgi:hypothetical protein
MRIRGSGRNIVRATIGFAALAAGFGIVRSANAALLVPGGDVIFTASDAEAIPAGSVIQNQTNSFAGTNGSSIVFTGSIQSEVILDAVSGDDDFVYQVANATGSPDSIDRLALQSYAGFNTDVGYVPGGTTPLYASRSTDGSVVGFNFDGNEIQPGSDSDFLVVKTNSTSWVEGDGSVIDGGTGNAQVTVPTFIVTTILPEPTTAALISIGGVLLMGRRRRS